MKINEHGLLTETLEISDDRMKDIAGGMPLEGIEPCGSNFPRMGKDLDGKIVIPGSDDPNNRPDN